MGTYTPGHARIYNPRRVSQVLPFSQLVFSDNALNWALIPETPLVCNSAGISLTLTACAQQHLGHAVQPHGFSPQLSGTLPLSPGARIQTPDPRDTFLSVLQCSILSEPKEDRALGFGVSTRLPSTGTWRPVHQGWSSAEWGNSGHPDSSPLFRRGEGVAGVGTCPLSGSPLLASDHFLFPWAEGGRETAVAVWSRAVALAEKERGLRNAPGSGSQCLHGPIMKLCWNFMRC